MAPERTKGGERISDSKKLTREQASRTCFFRVEESVLSLSEDWTRDEFALYLLHCRWHSPEAGCSWCGYKSAKDLFGMTRKQYQEAQAGLERRGMVRTVYSRKETESGPRQMPRTIMARASEPFPPTLVIQEGQFPAHDGHRPELTWEAGDILLPWRVIDVDRDSPEARMGSVRELDSLRLLVWAYAKAKQDGWIPSNLLYLILGDSPAVSADPDALVEQLRMDHQRQSRALKGMRELFRVGLLHHDGVDAQKRGVLFLTYPPPRTDGQASAA